MLLCSHSFSCPLQLIFRSYFVLPQQLHIRPLRPLDKSIAECHHVFSMLCTVALSSPSYIICSCSAAFCRLETMRYPRGVSCQCTVGSVNAACAVCFQFELKYVCCVPIWTYVALCSAVALTIRSSCLGFQSTLPAEQCHPWVQTSAPFLPNQCHCQLHQHCQCKPQNHFRTAQT